MTDAPDESIGADGVGHEPQRSRVRVGAAVCVLAAIGMLVWLLVPTDHCDEAVTLLDRLAVMPVDHPEYAEVEEAALSHQHQCSGVHLPGH